MLYWCMIKSFKQSWLEEFWHNGKHRKIQLKLAKRLLYKLDMMNAAVSLNDLSSPPSNNLHALKGDRKGQWFISVNDPWRLCFKFKNGEISQIEFVQYH